MVSISKYELRGNRKFGDDHYIGTYKVTYSDFKGEEERDDKY